MTCHPTFPADVLIIRTHVFWVPPSCSSQPPRGPTSPADRALQGVVLPDWFGIIMTHYGNPYQPTGRHDTAFQTFHHIVYTRIYSISHVFLLQPYFWIIFLTANIPFIWPYRTLLAIYPIIAPIFVVSYIVNFTILVGKLPLLAAKSTFSLVKSTYIPINSNFLIKPNSWWMYIHITYP